MKPELGPLIALCPTLPGNLSQGSKGPLLLPHAFPNSVKDENSHWAQDHVHTNTAMHNGAWDH